MIIRLHATVNKRVCKAALYSTRAWREPRRQLVHLTPTPDGLVLHTNSAA
jgi:hypothetical protein